MARQKQRILRKTRLVHIQQFPVITTRVPMRYLFSLFFVSMYLIIRSNADDTSYKIERLDIEKKGFGEGPHWDVESQSLFFVDLKIGNICMYTPATKRKISVKDWNGPVSFIVPVKGRKDHFVIGAELDVVLINWDTTKNIIVWKETLITVPDPPTNRLNDAKCDSTGRLWLGTMINEFTQKKIVPGVGFLYSYTGTMKGGAEMHLDNVTISNGIAISSDNKKFWFIDSGKFTVDQYDFNIDKGEISNLKTVFETKKHNISGFPDGMTIDNHGNLWVALYEGGVVIEVKPSTGELLRTLHFPKAHQTTSLAFGGPNLDELYVTTANEEVTPEDAVKYTESGSTYRVTGLGVKGLPVSNMHLADFPPVPYNLMTRTCVNLYIIIAMPIIICSF